MTSARNASFAETVAQKLIEQLEAGVAPWQKPWGSSGHTGSLLPMNPTTGKRYRGINAIYLLSQGRANPNWMTYKQASAAGAQVRKGEKGVSIQYWKFSEERSRVDSAGRPLVGADGAALKETVTLERPRVFFATVFNAEQIDGLALKPLTEQRWNSVERADRILSASGAVISHVPGERAFYRPSTDTITLPERGQFEVAERYYAVALHELGHWTGHASRLNRDLAHPFGSEGYAKEELRAEIASMILGDELGISSDGGQHASYVQSWIQVLQRDPLEIFRAAADAEKIRDFVIALEYKQQQSMQPEPVDVLPPLTTSPLENANAIDTSFGMATSVERAQSGADSFKPSERQYLAVPFAEKDFAKAAGALWDRRVKSWYVGPAADMNRLSRWMPGSVQSSSQAGVLPRDEFSEVLKSLGCIVSDGHPVMDGSKHRIQVEGDRSGEKAGFYVVHLDGHPAGYVKNNRTGQELRWKSKGYVLDPAQKAQLHADAIARTAARSAEIERLHEATAARLNSQLATLLPVQSPTPYLSTKGVSVHEGILTDKDGKTTCVPAYDVSGKLWSVQYIREDGTKRFAKDSRKEGCFHVVGGFKRLEAAPLIVIAEGYATAATLKQALRYPVVAAFDSGNLASVAMALHDRFANKPIVIAGDDDRHLMLTQGVNPGRSKAEVAAKQVGGHVVFPVFPAGLNGLAVDLSAINPQSYKEHERAAVELGLHDGGQLQGDSGRVQALKALLLPQQQLDAVAAMRRHTDFNDLAMSRSDGLAVVHRQLGAVLLQVQSEQRHFEQLAQQRQVRRERVG